MNFKKIGVLLISMLLLASTAHALNVVELGPEYYPRTDKGRPIALGYIYVGEPDTDPTVVANQKQISIQQEDGTIVEVAQPLRTNAGGVPVYSGSPVTVLVDGDYSLKVLNSSESQVYYVPINLGLGTLGVANGGTGVSTLADGGLVIGNAAAAVEVVAAGATTEILVGGGALTAPVWTTATGTGAPVRQDSPVINTAISGTAVLDEDDMASDSATQIATQQSIKAYVDDTAPLPRSYLAGLGLSNDTDTDADILVAVGEARNTGNATNIVLGTAITKQIDATWAAGDDAGGLNDTDFALLPVGAAKWYHVQLLSSTDGTSVDVCYDSSVTAVNCLADAAVIVAELTKYRRIGAVWADASEDIITFTQLGDKFLWLDPPLSVDVATPGTNAVTAAMGVPLGVQVEALLHVIGDNGSGNIYVSSLDVNDEAPSDNAAPGFNAGGHNQDINAGILPIRTNTSSQIRYRLSADVPISITTVGWIDRRGRDD